MALAVPDAVPVAEGVESTVEPTAGLGLTAVVRLTARIRWLLVSATYSVPDTAATATPRGLLKAAAAPNPSA